MCNYRLNEPLFTKVAEEEVFISVLIIVIHNSVLVLFLRLLFVLLCM